MPSTSTAKRVIKIAVGEAGSTQKQFIEPEDLLLGLLQVEGTIGGNALREVGVTPREVKSAVEALPHKSAKHFAFTIDEASDHSIYEQIVAQVTEAIATGDLPPRARLPSVRELADLLDINSGTVARAYGELETQGLVSTEGPRGTRVAERPKIRVNAPRAN